MSQIKVTSEELQQLSRDVATGSATIQEQLARLQGEITAVVGGEWVGEASSRFGQLWEEWQRAANGLNEALDNISTGLARAGEQYQQTEDAIRSAWA